MKNVGQQILYYILIGLFVLMIVFSFDSLKHQGQEGYDNCIKNKCEKSGQKFCSKFREINNCCLGSGGMIAQVDGKAICVFG